MNCYRKFARVYDALYSFKNYEREAETVHALISAHKKSAGNALLDVACGTGAHISFLKKYYVVEGVDLSEEMLSVARGRHPEIVFHRGDMAKFALGRRFDAVVCLFSAIAYMKTRRRLGAAILNMSRHLAPGGVMIVEPFFGPETFQPGGVDALYVNRPELKIARMTIPQARGGRWTIRFHLMVGTPDGIEYFTECHEGGLFSHEHYLRAFSASGLEVLHDQDGLMGRGLYIATSAPA
jgi:ubiquinone/menaquinone biosynthesis C-methylase UbiE